MDREPNLFLRNLRNKLGYGLGWTFGGALWEVARPCIFFVIYFLLWVWLASHVRITWVQ